MEELHSFTIIQQLKLKYIWRNIKDFNHYLPEVNTNFLNLDLILFLFNDSNQFIYSKESFSFFFLKI